MTRGIHLKELKNADLSVLGLEEDLLPEETREARASILAETDPVLSQLVGEVRESLEGTLELLQKVLAETSGGES